jgi:prolipoprotein diacylglyceryltransferase
MGVPIPGCTDEKFCFELPVPVYPTPFYETVACIILFLVLWFLRKRLKTPGLIMALYLMFNGIERFFIEKIRVNNKVTFLGMEVTQAEIISAALFLAGLGLYIWLISRKSKNPAKTIKS